MEKTLAGDPQPLTASVIWNSGFYLWRGGRADTIEAGMQLCEELLKSGAVSQQLKQLQVVMEGL